MYAVPEVSGTSHRPHRTIIELRCPDGALVTLKSPDPVPRLSVAKHGLLVMACTA